MEKRDWQEDFKEQCLRSMTRSVEDRMRFGFCYVYKPVLDDASWRAFSSTLEYRRWCRDNVPEYLGYGEATEDQLRILDET